MARAHVRNGVLPHLLQLVFVYFEVVCCLQHELLDVPILAWCELAYHLPQGMLGGEVRLVCPREVMLF